MQMDNRKNAEWWFGIICLALLFAFMGWYRTIS